MHDFVTIVDLPQPPEWFVQAARAELLNDGKNSPEIYRNSLLTAQCRAAETVTINGKVFHYGEWYPRLLSDRLNAWATKTLPFGLRLAGFVVTKGDMWPHTDVHGTWSLNYVIDAGGDNVETYWSKADDEDLRPGKREISYWRDHSGLQEIYSYRFPERHWVMFPVDIVHGTRNQTGDRVALTVKLSQDQYQFLKHTHELAYQSFH